MSAGTTFLSREAARAMPDRPGALSYDALVAAIQGAPVNEQISVVWSTVNDAKWHNWTGTIKAVFPASNGSVGSIQVRFTEVQRDLDAAMSASLPEDEIPSVLTWSIPGKDLYIRSINVLKHVDVSPEAVAAVARGRSALRDQKRTARTAQQADVQALTEARNKAVADVERLNTQLASAATEAAQANVRAQSHAAAAAQTAGQLQQAAAAHQELQQEYVKGEGMFFAQQAELNAMRAEIEQLRQLLRQRQGPASPSPIVPAHAHPMPVFSPLALAEPTSNDALPILSANDVETWAAYLRPDRVHFLTTVITSFYGVNYSSPLSVRRAYDTLLHVILLTASNTRQNGQSVKTVLEDARVNLRSEVSRAAGANVERVADEILRQDTKDRPFNDDDRWQHEVRADAAKARAKVRCHRCGQTGHIATNCRNKPASFRPQGGPKGGPRQE
jgi:hypothetical protein